MLRLLSNFPWVQFLSTLVGTDAQHCVNHGVQSGIDATTFECRRRLYHPSLPNANQRNLFDLVLQPSGVVCSTAAERAVGVASVTTQGAGCSCNVLKWEDDYDDGGTSVACVGLAELPPRRAETCLPMAVDTCNADKRCAGFTWEDNSSTATFCSYPLAPQLKYCSDEGEQCTCSGNVIYGRKYLYSNMPGSGPENTLDIPLDWPEVRSPRNWYNRIQPGIGCKMDIDYILQSFVPPSSCNFDSVDVPTDQGASCLKKSRDMCEVYCSTHVLCAGCTRRCANSGLKVQCQWDAVRDCCTLSSSPLANDKDIYVMAFVATGCPNTYVDTTPWRNMTDSDAWADMKAICNANTAPAPDEVPTDHAYGFVFSHYGAWASDPDSTETATFAVCAETCSGNTSCVGFSHAPATDSCEMYIFLSPSRVDNATINAFIKAYLRDTCCGPGVSCNTTCILQTAWTTQASNASVFSAYAAMETESALSLKIRETCAESMMLRSNEVDDHFDWTFSHATAADIAADKCGDGWRGYWSGSTLGCSINDFETSPYLQVNMKQVGLVTKVRIWNYHVTHTSNETDGCSKLAMCSGLETQDCLNLPCECSGSVAGTGCGMNVYVHHIPGANFADVNKKTLCATRGGSSLHVKFWDMICHKPLWGQYVTVELPGFKRKIVLQEVEIFVCPGNEYAFQTGTFPPPTTGKVVPVYRNILEDGSDSDMYFSTGLPQEGFIREEVAFYAFDQASRCMWATPLLGQINDHVISTWSGKTMESCKALCDTEASCKSIDFNPLSRDCTLNDCRDGDDGCEKDSNAAFRYVNCVESGDSPVPIWEYYSSGATEHKYHTSDAEALGGFSRTVQPAFYAYSSAVANAVRVNEYRHNLQHSRDYATKTRVWYSQAPAPAPCEGESGPPNRVQGYVFSHCGFWSGYVSQGEIQSDEACAAICDGIAECVGFSTSIATNACFSYNSIPSIRNDGGDPSTDHAYIKESTIASPFYAFPVAGRPEAAVQSRQFIQVSQSRHCRNQGAPSELQSLSSQTSLSACLDNCHNNPACGSVEVVSGTFDGNCTLYANNGGYFGNLSTELQCFVKVPEGMIVPHCVTTGEDAPFIENTDINSLTEDNLQACINLCRGSGACVWAKLIVGACKLYARGTRTMTATLSTAAHCWVAHAGCMTSQSEHCAAACLDGLYNTQQLMSHFFPYSLEGSRCPESHPYAFNPPLFELCCMYTADCNGNAEALLSAMSSRPTCCLEESGQTACSSPPCADYHPRSWDWDSTKGLLSVHDWSQRDLARGVGILRSRPFQITASTSISIELTGGMGSDTVRPPMYTTALSVNGTALGTSPGALGVAIRDVRKNRYVFWKRKSTESEMLETVAISTSDLAPYIGRDVTVDIIDADTAPFGWIGVLQVTITGACTNNGEFTCASDTSTPTPACPECTLPSTCYCNGHVKFGYGSNWTSWILVQGSVICSASMWGNPTFATAGASLCVCSEAMRYTSAPTVSDSTTCSEAAVSPGVNPLSDYAKGCFCHEAGAYTKVAGHCTDASDTVLNATASGTAATTIFECMMMCNDLGAACSGIEWATPPAPVLPPPSTSGTCHCAPVTLVGSYSAGPLVKCTDCANVSQATDVNSCPTGFKIFSPRSQEDWRTVMDSVMFPLGNPHFIVDVTFSGLGCGGCGHFAMNSDVPEQSGWHTSDDSPWWLRSTTMPEGEIGFAEPSSASDNCYLEITSCTQAGDIRFASDACNKHSTDYLCQPISPAQCSLIQSDEAAAGGDDTADVACHIKPDSVLKAGGVQGYARSSEPLTGRDSSDEFVGTECSNSQQTSWDSTVCSGSEWWSWNTFAEEVHQSRLCYESTPQSSQEALHLCIDEETRVINFEMLGNESYLLRQENVYEFEDPGAKCTDQWGTEHTVTVVNSSDDFTPLGDYTMIYDCPICAEESLPQECPIFTRNFSSRVAFYLNGNDTYNVRKAEDWMHSTSSYYSEYWDDPWGDCISDWGDDLPITVDRRRLDRRTEVGTHTLVYTCRRRFTPDLEREVQIREAHILRGTDVQRLRLDTQWLDPTSTCIDDDGYWMEIDSDPVDITRTSVWSGRMTYHCRRREAPDVYRDVEVREHCLMLGTNPHRARTDYVDQLDWEDPGIDCIDDLGNNQSFTWDPGNISRGVPGRYNVTYTVRRRSTPDLVRYVEIRDAMLVYGNLTQIFRPTDEPWQDEGADCIDDEGYYREVTSDRRRMNRSEPNNWTITYSCRRRFTPDQDRYVEVRVPFFLWGKQNHTVRITHTLYEEAGADCIDDIGIGMWISSERRRFIREHTHWHEIIYSCRRRATPDLNRIILVREAFFLNNYIFQEGFPQRYRSYADQEWDDPGSNCINDEGEYILATTDRRRFTLDEPEYYNITYTCRRRFTPDLVREVEVRDALIKLYYDGNRVPRGETGDELLRSVDQLWTDPGADCISHEGFNMDYGVSGDGFSRETQRVEGELSELNGWWGDTWEVTYSCLDTPDLDRNVTVRDAMLLHGPNPDRVHSENGVLWADPGGQGREVEPRGGPGADCIGDRGESLGVTSERRRILRDSPGRAGETVWVVTYSCRRRHTPDMDRTVRIRDALVVNGPDPQVILMVGEFGAPLEWEDPGAQCTDELGNNITTDVIPPSIQTDVAWNHTITYSCRRRFAESTRWVEVRHPIRLFGPNPEQILVAGDFDAPDAWDDVGCECIDRDLQQLTVTKIPSDISRALPQSFWITYYCTDSQDITASMIRRVDVRHPIKFTLGPDNNTHNPQLIRQDPSGAWSDPGHICEEPVPMDFWYWYERTTIVTPSSFSLADLGTTTVTYECLSSTGISYSVVRAVTVVPPLRLWGANPHIVGQHSEWGVWKDPGAECVGVHGETIAYSVSPLPLSTAGIGTHTATYSCIDTDNVEHSITRTVKVTAGNPLTVLKGGSTMTFLKGDSYSEPGACCVDGTDQVLDVPLIRGTPIMDEVGASIIEYQCEGASVTTSNERQVKINTPPRVRLIGPESVVSTPGAEYHDSGAVCIDLEDNVIKMAAMGVPQVGMTGNEFNIMRAGALGIISGVAVSVYDGNDADVGTPPYTDIHTASTGNCASCVTSTLVWVDLGMARTVHFIKLWGTMVSGQLYVGEGEPTLQSSGGTFCYEGISFSNTNAQRSCVSPRAGRYVAVRESDNAAFTLCEIKVFGTPAPTAPRKLQIQTEAASCDIQAGEYRAFSTSADKGVVYKYWDGSAFQNNHVLQREEFGTAPHSIRWVLRNLDVIKADVEVAVQYPPITGWYVRSGSCTSVSVSYDPPDACTWLMGFSSGDNIFRCADNDECNSYDCCANKGGVAFCPKNLPWMCRWCRTNANTDRACMATAAECDPYGGVRRCRQQMLNETLEVTDANYGLVRTRIDPTDGVDREIPGDWSFIWTCFDSHGSMNSKARLVHVGCEDPNPQHIRYGGNNIQCEPPTDADNIILGTLITATWAECAAACLAYEGDRLCEGYSWLETTDTCTMKKDCNGKYFQESTVGLYSAVCRRIDKPPAVILQPGNMIIRQHEPWTEPEYSCIDAEDEIAPQPVRDISVLIIEVGGNYQIDYHCTDTAGQTTTASRIVVVQASCPEPMHANADAAGMCSEGTALIKRGDSCSLQCAVGYMPNYPNMYCVSTADDNFESYWASSNVLGTTQEDPSCVAAACSEPVIPNRVPYDVGLERWLPCQESANNAAANPLFIGEIMENAFCTQNCNAEFIPATESGWFDDHQRLKCLNGYFEPSPTFFCHLSALAPVSVSSEQQNHFDMPVSWIGGSPRDCVFQHWHIQGRKLSGELGVPDDCASTIPMSEDCVVIDWFDLDSHGCGTSVLTDRSVVTCNVVNLDEGRTYDFRVREICTNTDLDSGWTGSAAFTLRYVFPPEILLKTPTGTGLDGILSSPGQIVLAITVPVTHGDTGEVRLIRQGAQYCVGEDFTVGNTDVLDDAPERSEVGLVNSRIYLILPHRQFFQPGCDYLVEFTAGVMRTIEEPSKPNELFGWEFTYIDEIPVKSLITSTAQVITPTGIVVTFQARYHLASVLECNCTRADNEEEVYNSGPLYQLVDTMVVSWNVEDLFPNTVYVVTCTGHKAGKPHIMVEPHSPDYPPYQFTSIKDTNTDMNPLHIRKLAICTGGTLHNDGAARDVTAVDVKTEQQLILGAVLLVRAWEQTCNGYDADNNIVLLSPGSEAYMQADFSVTGWSNLATIQWEVGPQVDFTFTKPDPDENRTVLVTWAEWRVCSHAWQTEPDQYPCQTYRIKTTNVDLLLSITSVTPVYDTTPSKPAVVEGSLFAAGKTYRTLELTGFQKITFGVYSSDDVLDWSMVTISLGAQQDGFIQTFTYDAASSTATVVLEGTGVFVPVLFEWMNVLFDMYIYINFRCPGISVTKVEAQLTTPPVVEAALSDLPIKAACVANTAPDRWIKLLVYKQGHTHQFCSATTFVDSWASARCTITPAAVSNLVVKVQLYNYNENAWVTQSMEIGNDQVMFLAPGFTGVLAYDQYGVPWPEVTPSARLDIVPALNEEGIRQRAELRIMGQNFPRLNEVSVVGAAIGRYQIQMQPAPGMMMGMVPAPEVPLCETINVLDMFTLQCMVNPCVDVRYLNFFPGCLLQLGDLRTRMMFNLLQLPQPKVFAHSPTETLDVGQSDFVVHGEYLGMPCSKGPDAASDPLCQQACLAWIQEGAQGTGAMQIFGQATGFVGDAECVVTSQNDTTILCSAHTSLRPSRAPPQPEEVLGRIEIQKEVDIVLTVGQQMQHAEYLPVMTTLMQCAPGEERVREWQHFCKKCEKGQYSHQTSDQWPLKCTWCNSDEYADEDGSVECTKCPANTESHLPADDITRCMCKPGYFSRWVDSFDVPTGLPGRACHECHDGEMLIEADKDTRCGENTPVQDLCDVPGETIVCASAEGEMTLKICMSACDGGRNWPKAKPGFYFSSKSIVGDGPHIDDGSNATQEMMPVFVECDPPVSCAFDNVCGIGYYGDGCVSCQPPPLKPYYREKLTNLCQPCGDGQVIGTIIMAAVGIIFSFGAFVWSLCYIKFQSDPVYENMVIRFAKDQILKPILRMILDSGMGDVNLKQAIIEFTKQDLLPSRIWITSKDLGIIFRVSTEEQKVYVAGVLENTPAHHRGIQANWRLVLVNGIPVKAHSEEYVKNLIAKQGDPEKLPMRLKFRIKSERDMLEDAEEAEDILENSSTGAEMAKSGVRMLTMSLGVMQCFKGIMSLKMDWPPIFQKVSYIIRQMLLNFDFFHPECSVAMPYWRKWCVFAVMPYCIVIPLTLSATCIKVYTSLINREHRDDEDCANVQDWMLKGGWLRCILICMLLFVNFHLEQLMEAFSCEEREEGIMVMSKSQSTRCSWVNPDDPEDNTYKIIFTLSFVGWFTICGLFSWLAVCLWWGYKWQAGCKVRDAIPWYVSFVETSTGGMSGHEEEVRERVLSNIVAVKYSPTQKSLVKLREQLTEAITFIGPKSQALRKEDIVDEQGQEVPDTIAKRRYILKCKDTWSESRHLFPEDLNGNIMCYSWILIINTFIRQLLIMLCVVFSSHFPPFGAAGQSLLFIINFLAVSSNRPYLANLLNFEEALLVACMGALTFLATFKELLEFHNRANDYPITVKTSAQLIDVLTLFIIATIFAVLGYNVYVLSTAALAQEDNANMLNAVHFERVMAKMRVDKRADEALWLQTADIQKDVRLGAALWQEVQYMESNCTPDQWPQLRQGANTLLSLFDVMTAPSNEKKGETLRMKQQLLAAGIRPAHAAVGRRKGSGIFTDLFAKALDEKAEGVPQKVEESGTQAASFKTLAAMIVAETEREVGQKKMHKQLRAAGKQAESRRQQKDDNPAIDQLIRTEMQMHGTAQCAEEERSFEPHLVAPLAIGGINLNQVAAPLEQPTDLQVKNANHVKVWDEVGPAPGTGAVPDLDETPVDLTELGQVVESWEDLGPIQTHHEDVGHVVSHWGDLGPVSDKAVEQATRLPPVVPDEENKTAVVTDSVLDDGHGHIIADWDSVGPVATTSNAAEALSNVVPVRMPENQGPTVDCWTELGPVSHGHPIDDWRDLGPLSAEAQASQAHKPKAILTPLPKTTSRPNPKIYDWNDYESHYKIDWDEEHNSLVAPQSKPRSKSKRGSLKSQRGKKTPSDSSSHSSKNMLEVPSSSSGRKSDVSQSSAGKAKAGRKSNLSA